MKHFLTIYLIAVSFFSWSQRFEVRELKGTVVSILPGNRFAYERLILKTDGGEEQFIFNPSNGKWMIANVQPGSFIEIRATMDLKGKKILERLDKLDNQSKRKNKLWFLVKNVLNEIKIGNTWLKLKEPDETSNENRIGFRLLSENDSQRWVPDHKIFLDKEIVRVIKQDGHTEGVLLENGVVGYTAALGKFILDERKIKAGDLISFIGSRMSGGEGYQYPVEGVKEVYYLDLLNKETGKWSSLLFKQNHVCIGAKFKSKSGSLSVSFPSYQAEKVRNFLKEDSEAQIFYGRSFNIKYNLSELHAIVQGNDTLRIEEVGFYGGADGKHDYSNIEFKGKITRVNKSEKGNVVSMIVGSGFYVEIDAMMAQQLGAFFEKGKEIIVAGKERVKIKGEIYNKDYRIITPEKIAIDGKTFSLYQP